jgi:hypothetical protein
MHIFKTARNKLKEKIQSELDKGKSIDNILKFVDEYEKDNLKIIEYLKRKKIITTNKIKGGLRQTINAHGPITKSLIGSSVKRIYGMFLVETDKPQNKIKKMLIKILSMWRF